MFICCKVPTRSFFGNMELRSALIIIYRGGRQPCMKISSTSQKEKAVHKWYGSGKFNMYQLATRKVLFSDLVKLCLCAIFAFIMPHFGQQTWYILADNCFFWVGHVLRLITLPNINHRAWVKIELGSPKWEWRTSYLPVAKLNDCTWPVKTLKSLGKNTLRGTARVSVKINDNRNYMAGRADKSTSGGGVWNRKHKNKTKTPWGL
jgi:hypothetical protein